MGFDEKNFKHKGHNGLEGKPANNVRFPFVHFVSFVLDLMKMKMQAP